jgi:hypothetical protein
MKRRPVTYQENILMIPCDLCLTMNSPPKAEKNMMSELFLSGRSAGDPSATVVGRRTHPLYADLSYIVGIRTPLKRQAATGFFEK